MGLADAFGKDDRMEIKVDTMMNLMERAAHERSMKQILMNAVNWIEQYFCKTVHHPTKPDDTCETAFGARRRQP